MAAHSTATGRSTTPQIKRLIRDALLALPAGEAIELLGPRGVGKRTLAKRLSHLDVHTSHHRGAKTRPATRRIRVHPITTHELGIREHERFRTLLQRGGFPSELWDDGEDGPSGAMQSMWEALMDANTGPLRRCQSLETLQTGLAECVGRTLSIRALAQRLGVIDRVMASWIAALEDQHGLFRLSPLPSPTAGASFRALVKDHKAYPYDWSWAASETAKLEALVINHLLQWVETQVDLDQRSLRLHYFRDRDQREVDAVVLEQEQPILLVQVDPIVDRSNRDLAYLKRKFPYASAWQLSLDGPMVPRSIKGLWIAHPLAFLQTLG